MLIAIPLASVIMGITMITLALNTDDGLVVDDYYRRGKEINREFARDRAASTRGLRGTLWLDGGHGRVELELAANDIAALPRALQLDLIHPTRKGFDQDLELIRVDPGRYAAILGSEPPAGHWRIQITGQDWRLVGRIRLPQQARAQVAPAPRGRFSQGLSRAAPQSPPPGGES
jgi:hypothetical protein